MGFNKKVSAGLLIVDDGIPNANPLCPYYFDISFWVFYNFDWSKNPDFISEGLAPRPWNPVKV